MSLEKLVDRAVTASGYDRAILALPEGARRMANVRKLMRLAREYEADSGRDLRGFIDFVDEQELLSAREGEAPVEGEGLDAVRLMTIHAAKGLEFPVVCVADLGREARKEQGALQVSADGRIGLQLESLGGGRVSAPEWERIKEERDRAEEAEEKRVFYVAMTRAEEHLVVSGATDVEKWDEPKPLGVPMDWAWRALAAGLPEIGAQGIEDGVRCSVLSPASLDALLPLSDRAPAAEPDTAGEDEAAAGEPPRLAPVASGAPLPVARLSYSALESYKRCGYRFYLERVVRMRRPELAPVAAAPGGAAPAGGVAGEVQLALGEPEPGAAPPELPPRVRGTIVHELLEEVDFARPAPPSAAAIEERLRAHGVAVPSGAVEELAALVEGALGSPPAARLAAARRVRSEVPFAFELAAPDATGEPLIVDGFLDVHAEEGGGALIVDYKTDALGGRGPEAATAEKYAAQRLVYGLAALRAGAGRVEVMHLFLERPAEPAVAVFEAADVPRLEDELIALADGIVGRRFEPAADPHRELCQGCPGQPALCTWGPERTLADRPEGETFGDPEPVDVRAGVA
jgi:ATP-dependent exoDNAse (exonuclease V) beta subunit